MNKLIFFLISIAFLFSRCARVGHPTGGKKDLTPPVTISAIPDFGTVNFKSDRIKIYFDEYIKFKDLNKQLIVSPPFDYPPEISPLGAASKYISIKINDTLKKNTTYTINFGNAITDNSEGNVLKQFKYVFSTGNYIDSLQVSGSVKDAYLKKSPTEISILLYAMDSLYNDSVIYKRKPDYITNTVDTTAFSITNIKAGKYLLLALKDLSNNMLYNPKEDKIAFLSHPVELPADTSVYHLSLFKEIPELQIKKAFEVSANHIIIPFLGVAKHPKVVQLTDNNNNQVSFFSYKDQEADSIHLWYKDVASDSLQIALQIADSISSSRIKLRSKEKDSLRLTKNIQQTLHLRDSLFILSSIPIASVNSDLIHFIDKDSVQIPFKITTNPLKDKFQIAFDKKNKTNYFLTLYPKAVTDFLGHTNDTLQIRFNTKKPEDYGEINLNLRLNGHDAVIIELLTDSGKRVARNYITNSGLIKFPLLIPKTYVIRAVIDSNHNRKWDPGNFLKKIQPERVLYYSKEIEVRANWSISEEFIVK